MGRIVGEKGEVDEVFGKAGEKLQLGVVFSLSKGWVNQALKGVSGLFVGGEVIGKAAVGLTEHRDGRRSSRCPCWPAPSSVPPLPWIWVAPRAVLGEPLMRSSTPAVRAGHGPVVVTGAL